MQLLVITEKSSYLLTLDLSHVAKDKRIFFFQAKYGSENTEVQSNHVSHRSQSVGFNGNRSSTQTPERDIRASSQAPNTSKNNSRRSSFSYLSLLPKDGSFPHRTQAIGDPQTNRRNSAQLGNYKIVRVF